MTQRILITGGTGAIGSVLANTLAEEDGNEVTVLDNLSSGHVENLVPRDNLTFIRGSVESGEDLTRVFKTEFNTVYHLAANFANQNSVDFPRRDLMVNGMGTLKLLTKCAETGVGKVIYSSSSCVYGYRDEPLSESCREYSLDTPYAITKLLGEDYTRFFIEHHDLKAVILRYFNVYGPNEYPGRYRNVIANFLYKAMRGQDLVITGTGEETRDFNFVSDSVRGTMLAAEKPEAVGDVFNIASGKETTINHIVELILKITNSNSKVIYKERRSWDTVIRRVASVDKAKDILGHQPVIELEEGLTRYLEWLQQQDLNKCAW